MGFDVINRLPLEEARKADQARSLDGLRAKAEDLAHKNKVLTAQNSSLLEQTEFLSDCLIELSELVYAHETALQKAQETAKDA